MTDRPTAAEVRGLTSAEKRKQAERCPCRGSNEFCACQNVPNHRTIFVRQITLMPQEPTDD